MTGTDEPDRDVQNRLRDALSDRAGSIRPRGDGLAAIQQRVARSRSWRWGPAVATAAVVAVAGASVAGVLLSTSGGPNGQTIGVTRTPPSPHHHHIAYSPTPVTSSPAPVASTHTSSPDATGGVGPATGNYYAVVTGSPNQVVEIAKTGQVLATLVRTQGFLSDLQLVSGTLYVVERTGPCATTLDSVGSGGLTTLAAPTDGWRITGYAVSTDRQAYAVDEIACKGAGTRLVSTNVTTGSTHTVKTPGNPPGFDNDPAWVSDTALDVVVRTGNEAAVQQLDPFTATSWSDTQPACPHSAGGLPLSLAGEGQQILVIAQTSRGYSANACGNSPEFGLPGTGTPLSLSTPAGADSWLTTSTDGLVWDREGSRDPQRVAAPNGVVAVAW